MNRIIKKLLILSAVFLLAGFARCDQSHSNQPISQTQTVNVMQDTYKSLLTELAGNSNIETEDTSYDFDGANYLASYSYDSEKDGKRPGIIVLPEWWGLNEYVKNRAAMLASLGYAAMAVDVFGKGDTASNPTEAMALIKRFNDDPTLAGKIVKAAIARLGSFPQVDTHRIAVVGYCFGGFAAIQAGLADSNIEAVVAFHPSLGGIRPAGKVKTRFLICHGEDDDFEKDNVAPFKKRMTEAGIDYVFKDYSAAKHAFTSPEADQKGKEFGIPVAYNASADSASWNDMKKFLKESLK